MADQILGIPYKKATISNVNGNVLTVGAVTHNSALAGNTANLGPDDVGRMITITTGTGKNAHRWITAIDNTAGTIETQDPWGVHFFRGRTNSRSNSGAGARFSQAMPAQNDEIIISYNTADLALLFPNEVHREIQPEREAATTPPISQRDAQESALAKWRVGTSNTGLVNGSGNRVTLLPDAGENGVSYNDINIAVEFDSQDRGFEPSSRLDAAPGTFRERVKKGYIVFGEVRVGGDGSDADGIGYAVNSCDLLDVAGGNQPNGSNIDKGEWHQYGGKIRVPGNSFLRFNQTGTPDRDAQINFTHFQNEVEGNFGGRISGDECILAPSKVVGYTSGSNFGYCNPILVGFIGDTAIRGSNNCIYNFFSAAGSTAVDGIEIQDIGSQIVWMNQSGLSQAGTDGDTLTLRNWSIDQIRTETSKPGTNLVATTSGTAGREEFTNLAIQKEFNVSAVDSARAAITGESKIAYSSSLPADIGTVVPTTTGTFDTQDLEAYRWSLGSVPIASIDVVGGRTTSIPYNYAVVHRDFDLFVGQHDLSGGVGSVDVSSTLLPDPNLTADAATVDAYTQINTAEELYNYGTRVKFDNPLLPAITAKHITRNGDTITTFDNESLTISTASNFPNSEPFIVVAAQNFINTGGTPFTGNINVGTGNLFINDTIRQGVVAGSIEIGGLDSTISYNSATIIPTLVTGTRPNTLIDTTEAVSGTLTLPPGSYIIRNADISGLTIGRAGSVGTVAITLIGAQGAGTYLPNVTVTAITNRSVVRRVTFPTLPTPARYSIYNGSATLGNRSLVGTTVIPANTSVISTIGNPEADREIGTDLEVNDGNVITVIYKPENILGGSGSAYETTIFNIRFPATDTDRTQGVDDTVVNILANEWSSILVGAALSAPAPTVPTVTRPSDGTFDGGSYVNTTGNTVNRLDIDGILIADDTGGSANTDTAISILLSVTNTIAYFNLMVEIADLGGTGDVIQPGTGGPIFDGRYARLSSGTSGTPVIYGGGTWIIDNENTQAPDSIVTAMVNTPSVSFAAAGAASLGDISQAAAIGVTLSGVTGLVETVNTNVTTLSSSVTDVNTNQRALADGIQDASLSIPTTITTTN